MKEDKGYQIYKELLHEERNYKTLAENTKIKQYVCDAMQWRIEKSLATKNKWDLYKTI